MKKEGGRNNVITSLFNEQSGVCAYCRTEMTLKLNYWNTATIDHVVPKSRGGSSCRHNLVAACEECNQKKGNMPLSTFLGSYFTTERRMG